MEEFPGVHVPVLMIRRADGHKLTEMLIEQKNNVVQLGLTFVQGKHDQLELDFWYSPDSTIAVNFLEQFYARDHGADLGTKIIFKPHFVLWHCDDCADKNYLESKPGCFSGGRYCALSGVGNDVNRAELVLKETIGMICFNNVLATHEKFKENPVLQNEIRHHYLQLYKENCIGSNDAECIWDYLENKDRLLKSDEQAREYEKEIRSNIDKCFASSFEPKTDRINPM